MNNSVKIFLASVTVMTGALGWFIFEPSSAEVTLPKLSALGAVTQTVAHKPALEITDQFGTNLSGVQVHVDYDAADGNHLEYTETSDASGRLAAPQQAGTYTYTVLQTPDDYLVSDAKIISKVSDTKASETQTLVMIKDDGSVRGAADTLETIKQQADQSRTYAEQSKAMGGVVTVTTSQAAASATSADKRQADTVRTQIAALERDISTSDSKTVTATRDAYDALSPAQKTLIGNNDTQALMAAERKLSAAAENEKQAQAISEKIGALGEVKKLAQSADITAARAAYDALSAEQKDLVSASSVRTLEQSEKDLSTLQQDLASADRVIKTIQAVGTVDTLGKRADVATARAMYDALSDLQKAKINPKYYKMLTEQEAAVKSLEHDQASADAVTQRIEALSSVSGTALIDEVTALSAAYDTLSDRQKALVPEASVTVLNETKTRVEAMRKDQAAADSVTGLINALGTITSMDQEAAVQAAREAYGKLTQQQMALVGNTPYQKLTKAEAKIAELRPAAEKAAAEKAAAEKAAAEKAAAEQAEREQAAARAAEQAQATKQSAPASPSDSGKPNVAPGDIEGWRPWVIKALEANGLEPNEDRVGRVLRQIRTESGGDQNIIQGIIDSNSSWVLPYAHCEKCAAAGGSLNIGHGLMQTIITTFDAYKFEGHGDIFNGYDNLLAAINYAKHAYGDDLYYLGEGHGY